MFQCDGVAVRQIDANRLQGVQRYLLVCRAGQRLGVHPMRRPIEHRHHQFVHLVAVHVGDEAFVDADIVNLLAMQLVKGVEAVPKTVNDQLAAPLLQLLEERPANTGVLQHHRIIDRQQQCFWLQGGSVQRCQQIVLEAGVQQAVGCQRQRDGQPLAGNIRGALRQNLPDDPAVNLLRQIV
ncbi:hypothetical protein D3C78_1486890 [compost metagenome]